MKKVLIVGAGGFVGGFVAEEGLRRGFEVWCGVRASTSRKYLQDPALNFVVLDFDDPETIASSLRKALPPSERWDYIIYNLGATKCLNFADFNRINYEYLRSFTEALKQADMVPEKMLYMSSLSVMGPLKERTMEPYRESDIPQPSTRYGASKLKAEMWLATCGIPTVIFRATGIYGPRDHDYFLMLDAIGKGIDFSVGFKTQMLTFIYVEDLCRAMYQALEQAPAGNTYIISEDRAYTQREYRQLAGEAMGCRHVIGVKLPLWCARIACVVAEKWGVARMKPSTLNRDKYNILRQRNWQADISRAKADFGFNPEVDLKEGLRRSVEWYRKEGWLMS